MELYDTDDYAVGSFTYTVSRPMHALSTRGEKDSATGTNLKMGWGAPVRNESGEGHRKNFFGRTLHFRL